MTEIIGDGKRGRRLLIRTQYGEWIEIPYGAGQDSSMRSLNIWNGKTKSWFTPQWWNRYEQDYYYSDERDIGFYVPGSFQVRAPGRTWPGWDPYDQDPGWFNPNMNSRRNELMRYQTNPGWLRLFHVAERNDPNWRIIPIHMRIPPRAPNRALNVYGEGSDDQKNDMLYFWPHFGTHIQGPSLEGPITDSYNAPYGNMESLDLARARYRPNSTETDFVTTVWTSMLDYQAIRLRLTDVYPQRNIDGCNQYNDISTQKLRRVIIRAKIECSAFAFYTGEVDASIINPTRFRWKVFRDGTGFQRNYTNTQWGSTYPVNHPSFVFPIGDDLFNENAELMYKTATYYPPTNPGPGETGHTAVSVSYTEENTYIIEPPGDVNLLFTAVCESLGPPAAKFQADINVKYLAVALHYSNDGYDVPANRRTHSDIIAI